MVEPQPSPPRRKGGAIAVGAAGLLAVGGGAARYGDDILRSTDDVARMPRVTLPRIPPVDLPPVRLPPPPPPRSRAGQLIDQYLSRVAGAETRSADELAEPVQAVLCDTIIRWQNDAVTSEDFAEAVEEAAVSYVLGLSDDSLAELVDLAVDLANLASEAPQDFEELIEECQNLGG